MAQSNGLRAAVMVGAGILLASLVAPVGWYHLHWIAYLPVFWALREDTPRANRWLLLLYGTVAEGAIFSWIAETITLFSNIPGVLAYAILGLFAVVFGLPYLVVFAFVHPLRKRLGPWWILVLPAWLVVVEKIAAHLLLFPYQQGVSQYRDPYTWQIASVTGVAGISYLVLFFNGAFAEWIYRRREGRGAPVPWMVSAVAALLLVVGFGVWRFQRVEDVLADAPVKKVLQLQSSTDMVHRMSHPASDAFNFWMKETEKLEKGDVDLAVWPEGAVPYELNSAVNAVGLMWDLVETRDMDLLVGSGTREREADPEMGERGRVRIFNSTYFFGRDALRPAEDAEGPEGTWERLVASGCDLAEIRVNTPYEAGVLAGVGESRDEAPECRATLLAKRQEMLGDMRLRPEFEGAMAATPGLWAKFRLQTERFDAPLVERGFSARGGTGLWALREASCSDQDCRMVIVRCRTGQGCFVGREAPHYDKMVPLPFGEYLPLAKTFPFLADIIKGPGNFRAGTEPVVFDSNGARFGTPICYEGILSYVCDRFPEIDLIVNVTNDAWFGPTAASDLHGMLVACRAIELGLPVFRSAYSGVSFVVEPHGVIRDETKLFEVVNRPVDVRIARIPTVFAAWGDWFTWLCLLGVIGASVAARRRRDG